MISAREGNIIFLKLGEGENMDSLLNTLEPYEVDSGIVEGFGRLKVVREKKEISDPMEFILRGVVSKLKDKPHLDLYGCSKETEKIRDFVSNSVVLTVRKFDEIKLNSIIDDDGKVKLSISKE